ncbi:pantothenate synthetase [Elysia marginata]|uniref:Pantoate--beta-alanine ligase n=1 Tax=Elysia marginata TaxID=1093978 RepID=A0AAV4GXA0_9GAST|nr:pantothenate synthetase [Elysia marginata]
MSNLSGTVGFVPTMGALHEGHFKLMNVSQEQNETLLVSIFINPTQFDKVSDLESYPRDIEGDINNIKLRFPNAIVFTPSVEELYGNCVNVSKFDLENLDKTMEGAYRQNHFQGVATVVYKLFDIVEISTAYFGEKDFQQLQIVRLIARKFFSQIKIVGVPIVRHSSGLAMSSRNNLLSEKELEEATLLYRTLFSVKDKTRIQSVEKVKQWVLEEFERHSSFQLEYFEVVDEATLQAIENITSKIKARAFIAARVGKVRLIDNITLSP